jgi:DNA polymerase-1
MTDLPVELDLERLRVQAPDAGRLRDIFVELEFRKLAERFAVAAPAQGSGEALAPPTGQEEEVSYRTATDVAEVHALVERARAAGRVSVNAEGADPHPLRGDLVGIALAVGPLEVWYLPLAHETPFALTFEGDDLGEARNLPSLTDTSMRPLVAMLEDPEVAKIGHDVKRTALALERSGVHLEGLAFDSMVASYVLDPGRRDHDLEMLTLELFARKALSYTDVVGSGRSRVGFPEVPIERARNYVCEGAELALRLEERFMPELEKAELARLFSELEMPLVSVLAAMELAGIAIDKEFFHGMRRRLKAELDLIQDDIHRIAGGDFNLNSTPQLRQVLFEKLGLPVLKRTKTGPSTDASVLEELAAEGHELPKLLMEYRELEKLRSTYVDALPQLVNPRTGRIHTSFNQAVAATGRLSSSDPNLQNIPIRTALGREIRKGFVADPGSLFLGVDYSQIELRILAHFSGDEAFVTAFTEGIDVHRQTASVIFDVPVDDVTPAMRAQAKTVNFATLYGQGPFSLARQLGISRDEARAFIETYFERFAGVRRYLDEQVEKARELGYVETLLGRRRHVPELRSRNWNVRQFGERVAQNTPIQGTAADLMKRAMIDVQRAIDERGDGSRLLLQVHDELLLEVPEAEVHSMRELVVRHMEGAMELNVPLVAEWGVGRNWYECKA